MGWIDPPRNISLKQLSLHVDKFCLGFFLFSLMVSTTGLDAYLLDSYPRGSGEMAAWFNVGRSTGGFIASYFELKWVNGMSPAKPFGI
jgi:hypothetical protein